MLREVRPAVEDEVESPYPTTHRAGRSSYLPAGGTGLFANVRADWARWA